MNIGIDIDGVLVNTPNEWLKWMENTANVKIDRIPSTGKYNYDLTNHVEYFKYTTKLDAFEFWNNHILYDSLSPLNLSYEIIYKLIDAGHRVIFISHTKGEHLSSKFRFLKKHFPFLKFGYGGNASYIATKEKNLVNVDVMIDDRFYNLDSFDKDVIKIYVETEFEDIQFEENKITNKVSIDCIAKNWTDIHAYFKLQEVY